jgi:hypothetical protein
MRRPNEFYLGLATLLLVAVAAALFIADPFRPSIGYPDVVPALASDADGRIRMDWNAQHPLVTKAQKALLRVRDGESVYEYPVDQPTLRNGGLDYLRKSGDVTLTLVLLRDGKPLGQAAVRAFVPEGAPAGEPGSQSRTRSR